MYRDLKEIVGDSLVPPSPFYWVQRKQAEESLVFIAISGTIKKVFCSNDLCQLSD
jgi:hypothetical protein